MKKIIIPVLFLFPFVKLNSQTLFTYGNKAVSKQEFVDAFDKNPGADTASRSQLLKEYLSLFINYKLKVQAAYDEHLNVTDEYKSEAANFKRELAETAVNNEANLSSLVSEAFTRAGKDIQLAQLFIPVPAGSDTTAAFAAINTAYKQLKNGKSFADVQKEFTPDSLGTSGGNIGYITVFSLPYDAENMVYNLHPGGFSQPYHSRIGYHIFKDVKERPAKGKRTVETILFATSPAPSEGEKERVKNLADSVYNELQKGASFASLQALYSAKKGNQNTVSVSVGQYTPDFEDNVFALEKEGDVSKPFATAYGYNIVKLIEKSPAIADTNDLTVRALMQEKVAADDRLQTAKKNMQSKWRQLSGYQPATYNKAAVWAFTDSALASGADHLSAIHNNTVLFSFTKKKITAADWIRFVQMKRGEGNTDAYETLMPQFVAYATQNYYKDHIEEFHPELLPQLQEFNDANLLFAAMDKHVWSKAANDSTGLRKYFNEHRDQYKWMPGATAIVVTTASEKVAEELAGKIKANPSQWRSITDSYGSLAQADSSRFENEQLPIADTMNLTAGYLSNPQSSNDGNSVTFVYITKVNDRTEPRSFEDAKGMVINDYQQVMENKWIDELRKKYPVKINETVFKSIR